MLKLILNDEVNNPYEILQLHQLTQFKTKINSGRQDTIDIIFPHNDRTILSSLINKRIEKISLFNNLNNEIFSISFNKDMIIPGIIFSTTINFTSYLKIIICNQDNSFIE